MWYKCMLIAYKVWASIDVYSRSDYIIWSIDHKWMVEEYKTLMSAIDQYMESQFAEQLKVYRDKEAARKEKDRLARAREQQRVRELSEDADERRASGEWSLSDDPDDVALKAHALFEWLSDNKITA